MTPVDILLDLSMNRFFHLLDVLLEEAVFSKRASIFLQA
jgi:hypothetical protein